MTISEIFDAIKFACDANNCQIRITWSWNKRFTRRMGDANYLTYHIRLSKPLWPRASKQDQYETVIHEACHIIAVHLYGSRGKGHGHLWKSCMVKCGVKPQRCHSVDRTGLARKRERVPCYCGCGKKTIGPRQAARIRNHGAIYFCRVCSVNISLQPFGMRLHQRIG